MQTSSALPAARRNLANPCSFPKDLIFFYFFLLLGVSQSLRHLFCPHQEARPTPSATARTLAALLGSPKFPAPGCASRTGAAARPRCAAPPPALRTPTLRATLSKPSAWALWIKGCLCSSLRTKRRPQRRLRMGMQ